MKRASPSGPVVCQGGKTLATQRETFGRMLGRLYGRVQRWLAYGLLVVAFVAGIWSLPALIYATLAAALLIIAGTLFDVQAVVIRSQTKVSFLRFQDACLDFRSRVDGELCGRSSVKVKWLGMSMNYGQPFLEDIVSHLLSDPNSPTLEIHVAMLDPDWKGIKDLNGSWAKQARSGFDCFQELAGRLSSAASKSVRLDVCLYRHVPNWHGFALGDRFLYLSECTWLDGRLLGGENSYELVDVKKDASSERRFRDFLGWFDYCCRSGPSVSGKTPGYREN